MRYGRTETALSISDKVSKVSLTKLSQVSSAYIQYEAKQEIVGADTKQIGIKSVYCPEKQLVYGEYKALNLFGECSR